MLQSIEPHSQGLWWFFFLFFFFFFFFNAILTGIVLLVSISDSLLLVYRNVTAFSIFTLHPTTLLNLSILLVVFFLFFFGNISVEFPHHLLNRLALLHCMCLCPLSNINQKAWVYFGVFYSVPLIYMSIFFLPVPGCFDYYGL